MWDQILAPLVPPTAPNADGKKKHPSLHNKQPIGEHLTDSHFSLLNFMHTMLLLWAISDILKSPQFHLLDRLYSGIFSDVKEEVEADNEWVSKHNWVIKVLRARKNFHLFGCILILLDTGDYSDITPTCYLSRDTCRGTAALTGLQSYF